MWPLRPYEFLPDRTFRWDRYVSLVVFARKVGSDGQTANLLGGRYLERIAAIEADIATNVSFSLEEDFTPGSIRPSNANERTVKLQNICLNWYGDCHR